MQESAKPFPSRAFLATGKNLYFDHNATTPICSWVKEKVPEWLEAWGNPSSIHQDGRKPKALLREARQNLAKLLKVHPLELVFTSGGSEANNLCIRSASLEIRSKNPRRNEILISAVEHPALTKAALAMQEEGFVVRRVPVNRKGVLALEDYKALLNDRTALVSVMFANNETGTLFPLAELVDLAHQNGALFHTDAVQSLGKQLIDLPSLNVDYASFSAHKFYALRGCGLAYIKRGSPFRAQILGGGQERSRRAGTENLLAIASFGFMAQQEQWIEPAIENMRRLRDRFELELLKEFPDIQVTALENPRLSSSSNLVIPGIDGETLLMNLDVKGFSVSTGAACSSGNPEPSPVLLNMGLSREEAQQSLRVSFGWGNTEEQLEAFLEALKEVIVRVRKLKGEGS